MEVVMNGDTLLDGDIVEEAWLLTSPLVDKLVQLGVLGDYCLIIAYPSTNTRTIYDIKSGGSIYYQSIVYDAVEQAVSHTERVVEKKWQDCYSCSFKGDNFTVAIASSQPLFHRRIMETLTNNIEILKEVERRTRERDKLEPVPLMS